MPKGKIARQRPVLAWLSTGWHEKEEWEESTKLHPG
ncbi:hypothetical protein BH20BAC1_BH20BAC1_16290 [soil metagenome]